MIILGLNCNIFYVLTGSGKWGQLSVGFIA